MTNPTSNFGWQMPTPTDLVTDLPADFEVFGQAVDTSLADLQGGTTGQILSKASNTDMDFTWITNDVGDITAVTAGTGISGGGTSGAVTITNSMATAITTAGDLIKGTGSGTFDRLGIGSTGQVLTVSGGAPVWAAVTAGAPSNASAFVATNQTTTSTTYTGLTTASSVTVTTGTKALVMITCELEMTATTDRAFMSYAVSGATTIAASDAFALNMKIAAAQTIDAHSYAYIVTGLTAGSNTFTTQFRSSSGSTVYFANRRISVVDMGS